MRLPRRRPHRSRGGVRGAGVGLAQEQGEPDEALVRYAEARQVYEELGDIGGVARAQLGQFQCEYRKGRTGLAVELAADSARLFQRVGDLESAGRAYGWCGDASRDQGDLLAARNYFGFAQDCFAEAGDEPMRRNASRELRSLE